MVSHVVFKQVAARREIGRQPQVEENLGGEARRSVAPDSKAA